MMKNLVLENKLYWEWSMYRNPLIATIGETVGKKVPQSIVGGSVD